MAQLAAIVPVERAALADKWNADTLDGWPATSSAASVDWRTLEAMAGAPVTVMETGSVEEMDALVQSTISSANLQEPFYVMDLGALVRLHQHWTASMPRVKPFYAVKCSPQPALLKVLANLGTGFDCASRAEIEQVLAMGVSPERIIFANPCKMPSHIAHAASRGVKMTTFDSEAELYKVKSLHPGASLLLRLRTDDRGARCPLGVKYGALRREWEGLLRCAAALELRVEGVSFHVGSGATDSRAFWEAIAAARDVFSLARQLKMPAMTLLDIGGGFSTGDNGGMRFSAAADAVNSALEEFFPEGCGVDVIAEPGRYFAEAPSTLATCVFGMRNREGHREYWINDGIYGSMNCTLYDHAVLCARPLLLSSPAAGSAPPLALSTVFGPTCDGLDTVLRDVWLPHMRLGDWLVFPNMGAYTAAAGSSFNGFATGDIQTVYAYSLAAPAPTAETPPKISGSESDSDGETVITCEGDCPNLSSSFGSSGSMIIES